MYVRGNLNRSGAVKEKSSRLLLGAQAAWRSSGGSQLVILCFFAVDWWIKINDYYFSKF